MDIIEFFVDINPNLSSFDFDFMNCSDQSLRSVCTVTKCTGVSQSSGCIFHPLPVFNIDLRCIGKKQHAFIHLRVIN